MTKYTYRDTTWRAMLMGSEGWTVFAGPKMLASHLTKHDACLIAAAPDLLKALKKVQGINTGTGLLKDEMIDHACEQAIRKAEEHIK